MGGPVDPAVVDAAVAGRSWALARLHDDAVAAYRARREVDADAILSVIAPLAATSPGLLDCVAGIVLHARLAEREIGKILVSPTDVDDAAQLTVTAVCRAIASFRGEARFSTWVGTIARRQAIDQLRRRRETDSLDQAAEDGDEAAATGPRLSSLIVTQAALDDALAAVAEPYREALRLRDIEGYSYDEIATRLAIPIGTVRSRISMARQQATRLLIAAGIRQLPNA